MPAPVTNGVVLERIENMRCDVTEIKGDVKQLMGLPGQMSQANSRLDDHDAEIKELRKQMQTVRDAIQPLIQTNKMLAWLAGIIGVSIVSLIWMMIIGQVQVVFP